MGNDLGTLGTELRERRRALGLSQAQVAARSGLRQEKLSLLERGRLPGISVNRLLAVSHALGLELELGPSTRSRPTLDTLLVERKQGKNTGPDSR